jgi:hypothetical protein
MNTAQHPTGIELNRMFFALLNTRCELRDTLAVLGLCELDECGIREGLEGRFYQCGGCRYWLLFEEGQPREHEFCVACDAGWKPYSCQGLGNGCEECEDTDCGCNCHAWECLVVEGYYPSDIGYCSECGVDLAFEEHAINCDAMREEEKIARGIQPDEEFMIETRAVYYTCR